MLGKRVVITGPPSCGKTSLLFRQALHCAERGQHVLYLAPSPLETLPLLPLTNAASLHPPSQLLQRIHFKYPTNVDELLYLLSTLHLTATSKDLSPSPLFHCILVDDFHKFVSPQGPVKGHRITSRVAQTCAYIIDALNYMEGSCDLGNLSNEGSLSTHHNRCITALSLSDHGLYLSRLHIDPELIDFLLGEGHTKLSSLIGCHLLYLHEVDAMVDVIRHWFPEILKISSSSKGSGLNEKEHFVTTTDDVILLRYRLSYPHLQIIPTIDT